MPTELEELVEFLHHGNTQIRQVAAEHLVGYSASAENINLFKSNQLTPIKDLKLLIRDYAPIAKSALTILINLSGGGDREILADLTEDEAFRAEVLRKIVEDYADGNVDLLCGLLVNLVKDDGFAKGLIVLERGVPGAQKVVGRDGKVEEKFVVSKSTRVLDQLMDVFVKGAKKELNKAADYDYLSYVFADVSKFEDARKYLLQKQEYDGVVPLTKLIVFLESGSLTRRKGVASTIKNICFEIDEHERLMEDEGEEGIGLLPYVLLPLAGNEEFDEEDSEGMLSELQLLPPDKEREGDPDVLVTHVETLLLLTTTRAGRDRLRAVKVYPIVRVLHEKVEAEEVQEVCERLVDILMRDEEHQAQNGTADDDHKIEEIL